MIRIWSTVGTISFSIALVLSAYWMGGAQADTQDRIDKCLASATRNGLKDWKPGDPRFTDTDPACRNLSEAEKRQARDLLDTHTKLILDKFIELTKEA